MNWNEVQEVAEYSNCKKRKVGCIITDEDGIIVAAGYNFHTNDVCDCVPGPTTAIHAEISAIEAIPEDRLNEKLYAYVNHKPCKNCKKALKKVCHKVKVKNLSKRLEGDKIRPKHYADVDGVPSINFFKAGTTYEGYKGYLQLTAMKYLYRLDSKDDVLTNARKAQWYINKLVEHVSNLKD